MRKQTAQWPDYYGDLSVQVYAPRFYYSLTQKKDDYSKKVVFGKNQDYSGFFFEPIKRIFEKLPFAPDLLIVLPSSKIGRFSPTLTALGKRLSETYKIQNGNIIERIKEGKKLTDCANHDERYEATKDSIKIKASVTGLKIVLLDDTKTTGMTILECTKALKAWGASEVVAVCLGINKCKKKKVKL